MGKGSEIVHDGSTFQGFTAEIGTIEEVNKLYEMVRMNNLHARHVVMAFRLPGKNFVKYQDGIVDVEYRAARLILNAMKHAEIFHRVTLVTRIYNGKQIGAKRFEAYLLAARTAILHNSTLTHCNVTHKPWSEDYCRFDDDKDQNKDRDGRRWTNRRGRGRAGWGRMRVGRYGPLARRYYRGGLPIRHVDDIDKMTNEQLAAVVGEKKAREWAQIVQEQPETEFDEDGFPIYKGEQLELNEGATANTGEDG